MKNYQTLDLDNGMLGSRSNATPQPSGKGFTVYLAAISAFLHIVNMGLSISYPAPAGVSMMKPQSSIEATSDDISWIASIGAISAILGACIAGYLSDTLGRKTFLLCTSLPFVISWLMVACGNNMIWIYSGRFITGFCVGLVSVVVPTYVVEISTPDIRGLLGAWFNVAFAMGVLMANSLGTVLPWSWLALSGAVLVVVTLFLFTFMPESPHWSINHGHYVDAYKALKFLRKNVEEATIEFETLRKTIEGQEKKKITLKEFLEPELYKPVLLSICIMFFQQFSGINAVMSYTVDIFKRVDSALDPFLATNIIAVTELVTTLIASVLMDRAGRRLMFCVSGIFGFVGLTLVGVCDKLTKTGILSSEHLDWMPLFGFITYIVAFNLGLGPIPWIMAPEMVPTHARGSVVGIVSVSSGLFMFIVVKSFDFSRRALNDYGVYLVYAVVSLCGAMFCYFLPETKGATLDEVQLNFRRKRLHGNTC